MIKILVYSQHFIYPIKTNIIVLNRPVSAILFVWSVGLCQYSVNGDFQTMHKVHTDMNEETIQLSGGSTETDWKKQSRTKLFRRTHYKYKVFIQNLSL